MRDDLLRLVFTCCHPVLSIEARVALALKTLCGLSTAAVARLFLVTEATMAQRLVRAKRRLAASGVPYRVPAAHELPERLPAVLATIHLLFTEGHNASSGRDHVRVDCCAETVRLCRLVADLMPDEPEVVGLLGLLVLIDGRRAARVDDAGDLVLLADQDRSAWDRHLIDEGVELVERALRMGAAGPAWGAAAGLDVLAGVDDLDDHHLRWAVEADLMRRLGRVGEAAEAYRRALACGPHEPEQRFLRRRLAEVLADDPSA